MDKIDRREILSRVAAGTISPEEAASQLDSVDRAEDLAEPSIRKVRIVRRLGTVEVLGDPTVREAVAEGPHEARIDGDVMVFEGENAAETDGGFFFGLGRNIANERLTVRVNPALGLELQLQAGSCRVRGIEGPIRGEIQAGSATIDGFKSEVNLSVQAGSLKASGCLDAGESRISCDAGSVNLNLEQGSSVKIRARATMGKVELPANVATRDSNTVTVGGGAGSLVIDANMGSVRVSTSW